MQLTSLYLASTSPRRRELLKQIGVQLTTLPVGVNETPLLNESAQAYVQRLSQAKAAAGWSRVVADQLSLMPVLGSDTSVVLEGAILGKPESKSQCVETLMSLSGRTHQVMTAVTLQLAEKRATQLSVTDVTFRVLSEEDALRYWNTGEPLDKAGGYGIQGFGAVFVQSIAGSYSGVVGLPIEKTVVLLNQFNVPFWQNS
ncbi:septum formation protein Maf [Gammaproteobacteria bacterium 42_54_T18]|nr:septum formation protein Maf [Gammaproteobacteria bacterium 42_54_T18]